MTRGQPDLPDPAADPHRFHGTLEDLDRAHIPPESMVTSQATDEVPAPDELDQDTWMLRYAAG